MEIWKLEGGICRFEDKTFKNYSEVNRELHDENQVDYKALPANSS